MRPKLKRCNNYPGNTRLKQFSWSKLFPSFQKADTVQQLFLALPTTVVAVLSLTTPFGLPAPIFWGSVVAWIPIPPAIMVGLLCATMTYAVLNHLLSLREWHMDSEEDTLHVGNVEEVYA